MYATYQENIVSMPKRSVWRTIRKGVESTITQFQSKAAHPAFQELKRQRNLARIPQPALVEKTAPVVAAPNPMPNPDPAWTLVLSDTDNDIQISLDTLCLAGLKTAVGGPYWKICRLFTPGIG